MRDPATMGSDSEKGEANGLLSHTVTPSVKKNILKRCLHEPLHRRKVLHSLWIGLIFISLGMAFSQGGPTLLDLQILTKTNLETASYFLTSCSIGYLVGSVMCGIVYDRVNKNLLLLVGVMGLGLFNIVTPYCFHVIAMIFVRAVVGFFIGIIDAAGNAEQMRVWGNEADELMQMLHFCFAIGGVLSPLYSEPFLAHTVTQNVTFTNMTNATYPLTNSPEIQPETTNIQYAFIVTGIFCIISGIPWLVIYIQDKLGLGMDKIKPDGAVAQRQVPVPILLYMMFMVFLIYMVYVCAESSFSSFIMTFIVKEYNETKSKGAMLTAVFWALFAASRFLMIFISQFVTSLQLLYTSCFLMIITSICFTVSAMFGAMDALVAFTALLGFSVSAVFPVGFSWTESQLMKVTSRVSASILVASSLGAMVSPILLGYMMERVGNMWFCYLLVIEIILLCMIIFLLHMSAKYFINKRYEYNVYTHEVSANGEEKNLANTPT